MYYKNPDDIYSIMSTTITNVDKTENSLVYNTQYPIAMELANTRLDMDEMLKKCFATSAYISGYSYYLEQRVNEVGLVRKLATKAIVPCHVTGKPNKVFPRNSIVSTIDNRLYYVLEDYTLDENGEADILVISEGAGSTYNVKANEITVFPVSYSGIRTITNPEEYTSAYDEETDSELYDRYIFHIRKIRTSGNKNMYYEWAMSVTGVGSCKVIPLWNGNGTVKCIITNSNHRKANQELIDAVKNYIDPNDGDGDGVAPIGAYLTVTTVEEIPLDIYAKVELNDGWTIDMVTEQFQDMLELYFEDDGFKRKKIKIAKVFSILDNLEGISDVDLDTVLLNNQDENILLTDEQIGIIGNITLEEM